MSEEIRELGEVAYVGYFKASGGKSLISGAGLPAWDEQAPEIRQAWNLGAMAVVDYWREAGDGDERLPDDAPLRYALVEQMGHRSTVATIRETVFAGKQMIEATDLKGGGQSLISPESIYEITWITEADAIARTTPWTPVALPAAHYDTWDERDDADRQGNGEPNDLADVDL